MWALWLWGSLPPVLRNLLNQVRVRVSTVTRAILLASSSNYRHYVGVALIAAALPVKNMYRLLAWTINQAAYQDPYYYFHAVRGDMAMVLVSTGFFLLMPLRSRLKYLAVIPLTEAFFRIGWMATVTSNVEYHAYIHWSSYAWGLLVAVMWLILFEYLMSLHFHKRSGSWARIEGILTAPGIDNAQRIEIAVKEFENLKSLK